MENRILKWPILIYSTLSQESFEGERLDELVDTFEATESIPAKFTYDLDSFMTTFKYDQVLSALIIEENDEIEIIIDEIRKKNKKIPIFILGSKYEYDLLFLSKITEVINICEDTITFLAGRILKAANNYIKELSPIFFGKVMDYVQQYKYPWHTPGHMGGTMFLTNPVGKMFFDFYGENTLRSDLSISVPELGSLLDREGPVKDAEVNSARVFGADKTYYVLNGTSSVNQIVWKGRVTVGDLAFVDRNCHKSLNYGMVITGAKPMYMIPRRNKLGIIGPVKLEEFSKEYIENLIGKDERIKMSALTNSTYDGLCYNVNKIKEMLKSSVDNLHFDEAWYAYAKFHPMYKNHYAMTESDNFVEHPPIFSSQSTHKLLGAFSQSSMLHVKDGTKEKVDFVIFDQAYMMYGSTSPQYSMISSLDVSTKMMDFNGKELMDEAILNSIHFRKKIAKLNKEARCNGDWFFSLWQPEVVPYNGILEEIENVPDEYLLNNQKCWILDKNNNWHGFEDIEDDYILLDPIKLTVVCPGLKVDGTFDDYGIPASILSNYIISKGVVNEKTDTYSLLFLHSIGTPKTKENALIEALLEFKRAYDANEPLENVFPDLVESYPEVYKGLGLKDHCQKMHEYIRDKGLLENMDKAFQIIPEQIMTPAQASENVFKGNIEHVPVKDCMNRVAGVIVVPYPPGIPVLMGGEKIDDKVKPIMDFLLEREEFERVFPGYYSDIHGIEAFIDPDGVRRFHTMVIKN